MNFGGVQSHVQDVVIDFNRIFQAVNISCFFILKTMNSISLEVALKDNYKLTI